MENIDDKEPKVGRPSDYDQKYCQMIIDYFSVEPYREVEKEVVTKSGDVVKIHEDQANDVPTLAGFAITIGKHRDTLNEWAKEHHEFSVAIKRAKSLQENFLVVTGNRSLINTAFGIFTMKNVSGWRDKQPGESDVVVNNFSNISEDEIDRRIAEKQKKLGAE